ncbi:hypothetical protein OG883_40345 [Streptomyces sp. NBC_01142]|uniref:hypothetical protein n=1 Tax=Streptomyces sp. NBC_01142 TaxID=2975865 RepID=UPI00224E4385|nr:hypothetical protein [Streptomyces sp. NBC_01142]MCX4825946.1 hypothetical protein [Streptomyces sp. NBC_01142]
MKRITARAMPAAASAPACSCQDRKVPRKQIPQLEQGERAVARNLLPVPVGQAGDRASGGELAESPAEAVPAVHLMAALEASVRAARAERGE